MRFSRHIKKVFRLYVLAMDKRCMKNFPLMLRRDTLPIMPVLHSAGRIPQYSRQRSRATKLREYK